MSRTIVRPARGLSLVELLIALALAALMLAPLAGLTADMATALAIAADRQILLRDAEFALGRMAYVIENSPPGMLKQGADTTTSGTWFAQTFKLANGQLVQTNPDGVLADNVTGFAVTAPETVAGQQLVQVTLTLARGDASASTGMTVRLGGAQ